MLAAFLLVSCSPPSGDDSRAEMSDLVGLWNSSEIIKNKTDIMYTHISSAGGIIEYDYDGDEVDKGLNCYQIDTGHVKPLQGSRFLVTTDMHANTQFEVELELLDAGNALKIYFIDSNDIDGDGDRAETYESQIWTRESDSSILENEPACKSVPL